MARRAWLRRSSSTTTTCTCGYPRARRGRGGCEKRRHRAASGIRSTARPAARQSASSIATRRGSGGKRLIAATVRTRTATGRSSIHSTTTGGTLIGLPLRGSVGAGRSRSPASSGPRLSGFAPRNDCTARRSRFESRSDPRGSRAAMCPWTRPRAVGWSSMNPHGIRAFAPGRANLIGEHTDYNEGLCLPFAVELGVTVTAKLRDGDEVVSADLDEDDPYLRGVVAELRGAGVDVPGCAVEVSSDLPREAGLSSSAALCVALVLALAKAAGLELGPIEVARMCSRIERDWTGADTGLLDQLASLLGAEGHALRLDMRTLEAKPVPLDLGEPFLAIVDRGGGQSLADPGYNHRR